MKTRALLCIAAAALTANLGVAAGNTWTGKITDDMCDKDHSMMASGGKQPDAKECTLACVKGGSKFVFVSGDKVYAIANQDMPDLKTYAGNNVKLTGELESDGKTIKAERLEASK
jgi:hypothetical protein